MENLRDFLLKNKEEILKSTEEKSLKLAGPLPSSDQLKKGLPIFFQQLLNILLLERPAIPANVSSGASNAASRADEADISIASGKPEEVAVIATASLHGKEMLRLGYTLSHVVHAYGSMCQAITELASRENTTISTDAFHDLNQCLDVAIAGAVTEFQNLRNTQEKDRETKHLGFLAHELRNSLGTAKISFDLIKSGTVGFGGNTGQVLERSLKRMDELIERSLTEVRLRVDPEVHEEANSLLLILDQILATAGIEAEAKKQKIEIQIDPDLMIEADQQAFYSALSNLIQNAIKFTREGGKIQVRGNEVGKNITIEVEDECGGLKNKDTEILFQPFEQKNENRKGLGLGLTIAQQAIELNHGTIVAQNIAGKGCIFRITLPKAVAKKLALPKHGEQRDFDV
jgi:signal transduction histidine kinase